MSQEDSRQRSKQNRSISVFSMKRLMHTELLQVFADGGRPKRERCLWLPSDDDRAVPQQPILPLEVQDHMISGERSRSETSPSRIPSPAELPGACPSIRRQSSSSCSSIHPSTKSSISAEAGQYGPEPDGSTSPHDSEFDMAVPVNSDCQARDVVNTSMEISAVLSSLIIQDLKDQFKQLPILEGFLEKLCPNKSMLKIWQTRFFFVDDDCLCYSREFIEIRNRRHPDYEDLIIKRIPFLLMLSITGEQDSRQFIIEIHDRQRSGSVRPYVLRAKAVDARDRWLQGVKQYAKHFRDMIQLGNLSPQSFDSNRGNPSILIQNS